MNFQDLKKIEDADFYIDLAFRKATDRSAQLRSQTMKCSKLEKSRKIELAKIESIKEVFSSQLDKIIKSFPSIDTLPEFYQELIKCTLDYVALKKSLGAVNWAKNKSNEFSNETIKKIRKAHSIEVINAIRREYYGRAASFIKQIKSELKYIENARKTMKNYPAVKEMFTVAIAGFPNVGKSTLLTKITSASPKVSNYPFTTKGIMVGYLDNIQFLDTPGTLNRFNKMNYIEKQAYLAIKYLANIIIYVFDPTLEYSLAEQEKLFKRLKEFDKPIVVYLSKTDIAEKEVMDKILKKYKAITDTKELIKKVKSFV